MAALKCDSEQKGAEVARTYAMMATLRLANGNNNNNNTTNNDSNDYTMTGNNDKKAKWQLNLMALNTVAADISLIELNSTNRRDKMAKRHSNEHTYTYTTTII